MSARTGPAGADAVEDGRLAARRRHPSARWRPPVDLLRDRIADRLAAAGAPHPHVGAALLAVRGATGLDVDRFAADLGVDPTALASAEAGWVAPGALPAALGRVVLDAAGRS